MDDHPNFFQKEVPVWVIIIIFAVTGVIAASTFWYFRTTVYSINIPQSILKPTEFQFGANRAFANADYFSKVKADFIATKKGFIEADLSTMSLKVYRDGAVVKEVPIKTKGREGSWWETPAGLYKVESKENNHFSSIGHVYQPYSMAFQGNFFIHGWPYYPDGKEVSSSYSGGCIRLTTSDAKEVFDLVTVGTPVLVFEKDFAQDQFTYSLTPEITAEKYLLADLKSDSIIFEKGLNDKAPIASITKLVTGLVAAEYIDLDREITITPQMIASTSKPRLFAGERVSVYNLMFPLLMESSNEAALAISHQVGQKRFVSLMNQKAKSLGMNDTTFADPAGISPDNVSTLEDLFLLAKYLYNNRSFIFKISAGDITSSAYGTTKFINLANYNKIPTVPDKFVGGKIGKTNAAGETYVGVFEVTIKGEKRPIMVAVLNSKDLYGDLQKMLARLEAYK